MKRKIVVGVWKDKLMPSESVKQAQELTNIFSKKTLAFDACVAPSPVAIHDVIKITGDNPIRVVSQDVHWPDPKRSFTGSTSIQMLKEMNVRFCMVGHSERRRFFNETNEDIYKKIDACIKADIFPILAVGDAVETPETRRQILVDQLRGALVPDGLPAIDISKMAIAYEPVWAISTWRSDQALPNGKDVTELLKLVEDVLINDCALDPSNTPLLYGGSVSPDNAEEYFSQEICDGALVGGASQKVDSLTTVFNIAQDIWGK